MMAAARIRDSELGELPALMTTDEFAALVGYGRTYISRMCKSGAIPAKKVGKEWRIPTRKALAQLGIEC
jgi:excisionase family DNA binding protein